MKSQVDENNYVENYVLVGEGSACDIEVDEPEGFSPDIYQAWRYAGEKLVYDEKRDAELHVELERNVIRARRERECYSVINRGQLWYEGVSISHLVELRKWYKAWLDAPATLIIPDKPDWLD